MTQPPEDSMNLYSRSDSSSPLLFRRRSVLSPPQREEYDQAWMTQKRANADANAAAVTASTSTSVSSHSSASFAAVNDKLILEGLKKSPPSIALTCVTETSTLTSTSSWNHHLPMGRDSFQAKTSTDNNNTTAIVMKNKLPQRLKDSNRFKLVKTEFCHSFLHGGTCPFGLKCHFAHSVSELQLTKLKERAEEGLIDLETYRTRPCFHHVSTGCCPFRNRCDSIHDPRISSKNASSWLPNVERMNLLDTTVHIDWNAKVRHSLIHQKHGIPFPFFHPFDVFYDTICDDIHDSTAEEFVLPADHKVTSLSAQVRLDMAIQMLTWKRSFASSSSSSSIFSSPTSIMSTRRNYDSEYMGTHFIYGEMCMVRMVQAFDISTHPHVTMLNHPSVYDPDNKHHVIVHELAFGMNMDTQKRTSGFYFNLPMDQFHSCTREDEVKYNRKVGQVSWNFSSTVEKNVPSGNFGLEEHLRKCPCFPIYYIPDEDLMMFIEKLMKHKLTSYHLSDDAGVLEYQKHHNMYKRQYDSVQKYFIRNAWPVNEGREVVDDDTPVPPADSIYNIRGNKNHGNTDSPLEFNRQIWESFVHNMRDSQGERNKEHHGYTHDEFKRNEHNKAVNKERLSAFELIGSNVEQSTVGTLGELPKIIPHHEMLPIVFADSLLESYSLFPIDFDDSWAKVKEFYNANF